MSLSETGGTPQTEPGLATRRGVGIERSWTRRQMTECRFSLAAVFAIVFFLHRTIDEITP